MTASRFQNRRWKCSISLPPQSNARALQITSEGEEDNQVPYLYVMVRRKNGKILSTVFRKTTLSGQYLKRVSFCHHSRKIHLIKTLTLRALRICSPSLLEPELEDFIKSVFFENGYPLEVEQSSIRTILLKQKKVPVFGPEKCLVYLKLPYIISASKWFRTAVKIAVHNAYNNERTVEIFHARKFFLKSFLYE